MTQARAPRRGRGRPTVFEEPTRVAYLALVREGARLGEAAQQLGIDRAVPARYAKTDREFAAALAEARVVGAGVRREGVPHSEYRYNVLECRCPKCTRAAAVGRAGRRAAEDPPEDDTPGVVCPIRHDEAGVGESVPSFLLARAS